ncbi:hypothetical protein ACWC3X_32625 [Streptomyces populi]
MILYNCWIETKSPGSTEWLHCEHFEEEADPPGMYVASGEICDGVDGLAQEVLHRYLASVLRMHADQPEVQVRAYAQVCDRTSVGPTAILQASSDDIAEARETLRLEALTGNLRTASLGVREAHRSLEAAIVKAHEEGLDHRSIANTVAADLDAQSVARLVDPTVLSHEVRNLIRTRPELAKRTVVRTSDRFGVTVELRWTNEEHDAEQLRECAWNETIEDYDQELAARLLSAARSVVGELLTLLSARFDIEPATPHAVAPDALVYRPVTVRRPTWSTAGVKAEEAVA